MYYDKIITPFPKLEQVANPVGQPLFEVAGINEAAGYIAQATNIAQAQLEVAQHIQAQVHRSLYWQLDRWPRQIVTTNNETIGQLEKDQITNCIGYSLVASELLSMANITNYLAYNNGHVMNLVTTPDEQEEESVMYLLDAWLPELNQRMDGVFYRVDQRQLLAQVNQQGQAAARIDTSHLVGNIGQNPDDFTAQPRYCWLRHEKGKTTRYGGASEHFGEQEGWSSRNRYSGIMKIYSAENGRQILPAYASFMEASSVQDADMALQGIRQLSGQFPELDARAEHREIKSLVSDLATQNRVEEALEAILHYCGGFGVSKDPRLKGLEARLYYEIAVVTGDPACVGLSMQAYLEAQERARYKSKTYNGRIGKLAASLQAKANS